MSSKNPFDEFFKQHPYSKAAIDYAKYIIEPRTISGIWVRLACQKFLIDLKTSKKSKSNEYLYYFDEDAADKVCGFFETLTHVKGILSGQKIKLEPWQIFYLTQIFGWKNKHTNARRYVNSFLEVGRKNGKSTIMAGLMLYGLAADGEHGAEVYSFANKRDQARLVFNIAKEMVRINPSLTNKIDAYEHRIEYKPKGAPPRVFKPMASKTNSLDGLSTHFASIDELHEMPDDKLYNVIKSSVGSRTQPHLFIITTSGFSTSSFCFQLRETLIKVLKGDLVDEQYFSLIYELDEEDDWEDESLWVKANPNMDVSVSTHYLQHEKQQAINFPSEISNFKTKHLNMWQNSSATWITQQQWKTVEYEYSDEELSQYPCYGGLDMSSTRDFTAFTLLFLLGDNKFHIKTWLWLPQIMLQQRERKDKNHYTYWKEMGWIRSTSGNIIDEADIFEEIRELSTMFQIESIAYDRKFALNLVAKLEEIGVPMNDFPQHMKNMCPATKQFEIYTLKEEMTHAENPCMDWMMSNVHLFENYNGEVKPDKKQSQDKIDGPVSAVIAMGEYLIARGREPDGYDEIATIEWV